MICPYDEQQCEYPKCTNEKLDNYFIPECARRMAEDEDRKRKTDMQLVIKDDAKLADILAELKSNPADEVVLSRGLFVWLLGAAMSIPDERKKP